MVPQSIAQKVVQRSSPTFSIGRELRTELIRKSIHLLIAAVPLSAALVGPFPTLIVLALGTLVYSFAEALRQRGGHIPIISRVTELASRKRDLGHFVLGPVTLGIGAMLALMLYPEPAASIAIYALAFGDGLASVVGKLFGRIEIPLTRGKTLEGTLTCVLAVFLTTYLLLGAYSTAPQATILTAVGIAVVAGIVEALPLDDADNLALPIVVGLSAHAAVLVIPL